MLLDSTSRSTFSGCSGSGYSASRTSCHPSVARWVSPVIHTAYSMSHCRYYTYCIPPGLTLHPHWLSYLCCLTSAAYVTDTQFNTVEVLLAMHMTRWFLIIMWRLFNIRFIWPMQRSNVLRTVMQWWLPASWGMLKWHFINLEKGKNPIQNPTVQLGENPTHLLSSIKTSYSEPHVMSCCWMCVMGTLEPIIEIRL